MYLSPSDFTGFYKISTNNFTEDELTLCIAEHEKKYLKELLGIDLYALFEADLTGGTTPPPLTAKYLTIYSALEFDNTHGGIYTGGILSGGMDIGKKITISKGMKTMLKGFIYFEYVRLQSIENGIGGNVEPLNENSAVLRGYKSGAKLRYNKAVQTYQAIQAYIADHSSDYPDFNGQAKEIIIY